MPCSETETEPDQDIFAPLLSLEDQYYTEGHTLGVADGSRTGRIEGRLFGLEKGYAKAVAMGRLNGRGGVWSARLSLLPVKPSLTPTASPSPTNLLAAEGDGNGNGNGNGGKGLAVQHVVKVSALSGSQRLRTHISRLHELTDPESLETRNTEDAVNEFDERLAGARAKATLVAKIVGEDDGVRKSAPAASRERTPAQMAEGEGGEVDITGVRAASKAGRGRSGGGGKQTGEMEDFAGLPQLARKAT
ncbi:hypothetical protein LTR36_008204 [Oleoguttula mirabilis]|uniref:Essential protein Yae1 N-terminal domain-containing protein n=1 Tax=Oleoguttula mirabilis TaxID=1507867 RepID=A0AAV9J970_9PEZI|nr:hypothetical protein LTR36_008204 [Oleoguttula mirabilis]